MINIVEADESHCDILALMNKQLIEDEQHDNMMNYEQLKARMYAFLLTDYKAILFKEDDTIKGYALVNMVKSPYYLRQFFISRDSRRLGYGKRCFQLLLNHLGNQHIDVEVMYWNKEGYKFWKSLGFEERSVYLRLDYNQVVSSGNGI